MFENFKYPPLYSKIDDKLFLGNMFFVTKKHLKEYKISHVISILNKYESQQITKVKGINYLTIDLEDHENENIADHFNLAADFIENGLLNGTGVFVHCFAGVSRSPTILAAYFIIKRKMTADEALLFILQKRSIKPNEGFLRQLRLIR
jgi:dual specificity phosphatase 12